MELTLDDLLIRASSHTPFFGIYLASHAIVDAMCMCHASVGCKVKTQEHLVSHDGVQDAHNRRRYSQLIDEDLIQGSTAQLEDEISAFATRLRSQLVVIDCSTPLSLQVQPLAAVVERMRAKTGVDVVHVPARNYQDDLYGGYAATVATLFRRQFEKLTQPPQPRRDEVSIVGLPFDRYEGDCVGNVGEIRRLLWGLGLKAKAVWLAGEPYATLAETVHARGHLVLPWAHGVLRDLAKAPGLPPDSLHPVAVPMGFQGTRRWLQQAAVALAIPAAKVDALCNAELAAAKPLAELARQNLRGHAYIAFAEAPRLAGLVALLTELDMVPTALGVLHFRLGGRQQVEALLAEQGITLPASVVWLEDPAPHEVRALARRGADGARPLAERVSIIVGTTVEAELLAEAGRPTLEFGFPSENRHFLLPAPWMGFRGALRFAEQIMQSVRRNHDPDRFGK